ncbi:MAG: GNAT family N-acetyltransferase [Oscillospiraceae bacterium]|nr:GNAT family N-acetyltransferase [Oscillospiraceae bacterium]
MNLKFIRIISESDKDISYIQEIHQIPQISRYINISDNYFTYVTENPNVYLYKVYLDDILVGTTHLEICESTLYMDVIVIPQYQHKGIGTNILRNIQNGCLPIAFERIEVSIDENNTASKRLFEKAGFIIVSKEDELENYLYTTK